jgi:hypothetical protein
MTTEERTEVKKATRATSHNPRWLNHSVYLNDTKNKEFFETWNVPVFEFSERDKYHTIESGEEGIRGLAYIAYVHYRQPELWWVIATANNIFIPTEEVVPGVEIRIPSYQTVLRKLV